MCKPKNILLTTHFRWPAYRRNHIYSWEMCKNHTKLGSYINPYGNDNDIEWLNQIEGKDGHLKLTKRLCIYGVK